MAQFAAFIPYIVAAGGTLLSGSSEKGAARSQALQLEQQAGQDRATSQRAAAEQRRSARYLQSRALALAAASGAGASDPTVTSIISNIEGEGEYGALVAMYEGEDVARGKEHAAAVARKQGKAAATAGALKAGGTLLSGGSSWYDKYGGRGAPGAPGTAFSRNGSLKPSVVQGTSIADYGINSTRYA